MLPCLAATEKISKPFVMMLRTCRSIAVRPRHTKYPARVASINFDRGFSYTLAIGQTSIKRHSSVSQSRRTSNKRIDWLMSIRAICRSTSLFIFVTPCHERSSACQVGLGGRVNLFCFQLLVVVLKLAVSCQVANLMHHQMQTLEYVVM
jgi:hypothetical protein